MKPSKMFVPLLVLLLGVIMVPLAAVAQCGGWVPSGFGGPTHIVFDPMGGGVYYGGPSGARWEPLLADMQNNTLDYHYFGSTFSLLNSFLPSAFAQCGGGPHLQNPVVSLTATPGTINLGNSSSLTWGSANVTSCTGTGFSTGGETRGTVPVSPTSTTEYSITCSTGSGGNGTWQYESTDYTDLACPVTEPERVHRDMPDCPNGDPSGMRCTPGQDNRCKINSGGGGANGMSGSCVVETAIYSCEGSGSVSDDATVVVNSGGPLAVSCSANPNPQSVDDSVTWSANVSGGEGGYTYSWSGSDGLTGSGSSVQKSYSTTGSKSASVMVTSGTQATSVACEALEVENPVAPECSDGIDNNGTGGVDTQDTEACDGPNDEDENNPNGNLSCAVDSTLIDVGENTTYHAIGVAGPYTWQLSGQTNCSGGANNNCTFPDPGEYSMRVSAPGVGAPKLCPFVTAGCAGTPAANIEASRTRVNPKDTVNLTWNASGVMQATCVISGPGVNQIVQPTSCQVSGGPLSVQVLTQSIYTIDCGEDAVDSVIVNVTSDQIEF